jgi:predicted short-subunit dehydrogenase-like oxidoreductase (DUF2520 family)
MKKPPRVALIGAGKFSNSPVTRMRNLNAQLGPVKAPSLRVASRISNSLRAGHPVSDYRQFEHSELILVSVPDDMLASILAELAASLYSWQQKTVVACSDEACSGHLSDLAALGAATGTLAMVPGYEDRWCLVEGEKAVERQLRPVLGELRVTHIDASQKQHYLQALTAMAGQFMPCLRHASEALRNAGIPSPEVNEIVERQVTRTMRSYFRSGKT